MRGRAENGSKTGEKGLHKSQSCGEEGHGVERENTCNCRGYGYPCSTRAGDDDGRRTESFDRIGNSCFTCLGKGTCSTFLDSSSGRHALINVGASWSPSFLQLPQQGMERASRQAKRRAGRQMPYFLEGVPILGWKIRNLAHTGCFQSLFCEEQSWTVISSPLHPLVEQRGDPSSEDGRKSRAIGQTAIHAVCSNLGSPTGRSRVQPVVRTESTPKDGPGSKKHDHLSSLHTEEGNTDAACLGPFEVRCGKALILIEYYY